MNLVDDMKRSSSYYRCKDYVESWYFHWIISSISYSACTSHYLWQHSNSDTFPGTCCRCAQMHICPLEDDQRNVVLYYSKHDRAKHTSWGKNEKIVRSRSGQWFVTFVFRVPVSLENTWCPGANHRKNSTKKSVGRWIRDRCFSALNSHPSLPKSVELHQNVHVF